MFIINCHHCCSRQTISLTLPSTGRHLSLDNSIIRITISLKGATFFRHFCLFTPFKLHGLFMNLNTRKNRMTSIILSRTCCAAWNSMFRRIAINVLQLVQLILKFVFFIWIGLVLGRFGSSYRQVMWPIEGVCVGNVQTRLFLWRGIDVTLSVGVVNADFCCTANVLEKKWCFKLKDDLKCEKKLPLSLHVDY